MARADSKISVAIDGDARGLQKAVGKAEKEVGGLSKGMKALGAAVAAGFAVDAVVDFGKTALAEADRLGDATGRLESQLGDLAAPLVENADNFARLGQSAQDILELEAAFVDVGTAAGVADDALAPMAEDAAEAAAALALITDLDAETALDLIAKAGLGGTKALRELGVSLTDAEVEARALRDTGKTTAEALTEGELAAAGMALVLEKLQPRLQEVTNGLGDTEAKAAEFEARWETLTGRIGAGLEGPMNDLLGWILSGIDGWTMLADQMESADDVFRKMLGPIGALGDALDELGRTISRVLNLGARSGLFDPGDLPSVPSGGGHPSTGGGGGYQVQVNVQSGDPIEVERAVSNALRKNTARNGQLQ